MLPSRIRGKRRSGGSSERLKYSWRPSPKENNGQYFLLANLMRSWYGMQEQEIYRLNQQALCKKAVDIKEKSQPQESDKHRNPDKAS